MNRSGSALVVLLVALPSIATAELAGFCDRLPRPAYAAFDLHPASTDWFEVYQVADGVTAIYEPFQWQEVISYLIEGDERAILFDTGNGIEDIKAVVDDLTDLPIVVINSHSHYDHIGGNHAFDVIWSVSTEFSLLRTSGIANADVRIELSEEALCKPPPGGATEDTHSTRPYQITAELTDGQQIDLGNRALEIVRIPGHTDDSVALLDRERGYLWTGDTYYAGPIWLFAPQTDLAAYRKSIRSLAEMAPSLTALFPAHNTPREKPSVLYDVARAFDAVVEGEIEPASVEEGIATFEFDGFAFKLRADFAAGL